jgi:hypothetical protein
MHSRLLSRMNCALLMGFILNHIKCTVNGASTEEIGKYRRNVPLLRRRFVAVPVFKNRQNLVSTIQTSMKISTLRVQLCERTDVMKLIVAFHNF